MDKKSEEYLRQYIKLTDALKQKIEAHAARYHIKADAALEDGKDELDVYSEMLETGIDIKMVRKYLGDDAADHMKDFCKEHGLI